jgi:signal transduction histidine kinase
MSHTSPQLGPLEQLLEPLLLLDKHYTILDLNQTACNLLQTSKEAFIDETFPFDLRLNEGLEVEIPDSNAELISYTILAQAYILGGQDCLLVRFFQSTWLLSNSELEPVDPALMCTNILESLNIAAFTTDQNGRIAHCTQAVQALLFTNKESLIGKSAAQILNHSPSLQIAGGPPLGERLIDLLKQENPPSSHIKLALELEDAGSFELVSIALEDPMSASLANQFIIFNELNSLKQSLQQQSLAGKQLQLMAAGIAHDFKNLLSAIISQLSIARLKIENTEATEKLNAAEEAAWQAKTLSQRLMHLADSRKPTMGSYAAYCLARLLRACVELHLKNSKISYQLILDEPLGECTVEYTQMSQVINNLLINAKQSMPAGGHIEITAHNSSQPSAENNAATGQQQDFICIRIRDTGPGISRSHQSKIFEPYFTTKVKGNGIGLANCKNIIDAHQGQLRVESTIGRGSTFIIQIPQAIKSSGEKEVVRTPTRPAIKAELPTPEKDLQPKGRILVMDDLEAMRDVAGDILKLLDYECALTADGQAAVDLYLQEKKQGRPFDAVLFDLTVPGGMGGEEAAAIIKKIEPNLKAIACSGYADSDLMQNYAHSPFTTVVPKPYRMQEMRDALRTLLEGN